MCTGATAASGETICARGAALFLIVAEASTGGTDAVARVVVAWLVNTRFPECEEENQIYKKCRNASELNVPSCSTAAVSTDCNTNS